MQSKNSILTKKAFANYSIKNGFIYHNSLPVVAPANSRLLFNISGGVCYQNELLGKRVAVEPNVSSIQKCLRTDNLENIGVSGRHHILFEMIGHFMLYSAGEKETKERFIKFAYGFLTKELKLDSKRIFITAYPDDMVTKNIWRKLGVNNLIEDNKNTFVSPYGEKSALRTEILWQKSDKDKTLVELWNLVFTQFDSKMLFENPSVKIGADSGASLERIVSAIEDRNNNYENSMWNSYIEYIKNLGKRNYDISKYRKIADLANASIELVNEKIKPNNKTQGYMLRKIMRKFYDLCDFDSIDPEEVLKFNNIDLETLEVFQNERKTYFKSVENGLKQAKKQIDKYGIENLDRKYLKSTYGLSEMYIEKIISRCQNHNTNKKIVLCSDEFIR